MQLALLVAASLAMQAGYFQTGNSLHEECQQRQMMYVIGYVAAVTDTMNTFPPTIDGTELRICVPEQATIGQLADVVCQYIEKHPATRHAQVPLILYRAYTESFPCSQQR